MDEVLNELKAAGFEIQGEQVETPVEPEAPLQEEAPEEPQDTTEDPQEPVVVNRVPKEPTVIPAWKAKIAEERLSKENAELRAQIEAYQKAPTQENKQEVRQSIADIRQLAQEEGLELDERQERFFNKMASALTQNAVPQDLLKNVEAFAQQQQIDHLEREYEQEFSKDVLPLIKEQYGELPEKELATLRQKLHDTAFSETYAKVPLKKVFLAESQDLAIKTPKQPIVTNRSGRTRNADIDLSNIDEQSFASLSDDQVDAFIAKKAGNGTWSRR